jgi:hypothetical protein
LKLNNLWRLFHDKNLSDRIFVFFTIFIETEATRTASITRTPFVTVWDYNIDLVRSFTHKTSHSPQQPSITSTTINITHHHQHSKLTSLTWLLLLVLTRAESNASTASTHPLITTASATIYVTHYHCLHAHTSSDPTHIGARVAGITRHSQGRPD